MAVKKVVILTTGTSWTVPLDWTDAGSTLEVVGAGGGGGRPNDNVVKAAGGAGAGAYSAVTAISLTAGSTLYYNVGALGTGATVAKTDGATGGDAWVN